MNALVNVGFERGEVDPCLIYRKNEYDILILILYVNDCLLTGDTLAIESGINDIKKMFNVTVTKKVEEYLGCRIDTSRKGEITVHQPHIYKHLQEKFQDVLGTKWKEEKRNSTPSTPSFRLMRVKEGEGVLSPHDQTLFRCGVGILLYLVKHTRPDLANATRELSRAMDVANYVHWKELLRVIKYALKTQEKGIVLRPERNQANISLKLIVDAEFAGNKDTRKSIMGRVIYLNEAPIGWNSKGQGSVTLSSTEAEYVSMSEGMKDLLFVKMCLNYIKMKINLPMIVLIDNIGAIEMLDSKTGQCKTKHIDTRYHWIKQYVNEDKVRVDYIKSEENVADILTKNLNPKLFEKHASKLVTNIVDKSKQMNDVGFFVRCNPRRIGKAGTWRDTCWAREDLFAKLAAPMGEIRRHVCWDTNYDITTWYPNGGRLKRLRRKVEGPLQRGYWNRKYDRTGKFVYPSERHVIKKFRNSYGDVVNIYDTDRKVILD